MPELDAAVIPEDVLEKAAQALSGRYGNDWLWSHTLFRKRHCDDVRTVLRAADYPALQARVRELEGALRFYADQSNWRNRVYEPDALAFDLPLAYEDKGQRARQSLNGGAGK